MLVRWLLFAPIGALILGQAYAAEVARSAKSGEPTLIRRYFAWNPDCSFKRVDVRLTTMPQHGKITPKFGDHTLETADLRTGSLSACEGRKIRVVELHYTSDHGFVGHDHFSVRVSVPGLSPVSDDYLVDVE
jgi:hypothetical protein